MARHEKEQSLTDEQIKEIERKIWGPAGKDPSRRIVQLRGLWKDAPFSFDVVAASASIDDIPELHDRVIAGTAVWLNIPILTNDPDMIASRHVQTIWR